MIHSISKYWLSLALLMVWGHPVCAGAGDVMPAGRLKTSVADYGSIQEALDANPGRMMFVPAGDHEISKSIHITAGGSGLYGPGRIIQTNPDEDIIMVESASGNQLRDLILQRPEGKTDTVKAGIEASKAPGLVLDGITVRNNCTRFSAILITESDNSQIRNCLVENYMRVCEEDRRDKPGQGYAFMTLGGTGIDLRASAGVLLQGTRVIESTYLPTEEMKEKYGLGKFTKRGTRGTLVTDKMWAEGYFNVWHQGAAVHIGVPDKSDYIQVLGNYVENAAQGIDVQGDHVILANNIVNNAFLGVKAVHGSRNAIITGNQFSKNDYTAIKLGPALLSHAAGATGVGGKPLSANIDGYSVVADNIVSDFGFGSAAWMWKDVDRYVMWFDEGQAAANPPLSSVLVRDNIVYDTGKDGILEDGKPQIKPPGYQYAVFISQAKGGPVNLQFFNNILSPGTKGASNAELKP